jgi:hypothetical protein
VLWATVCDLDCHVSDYDNYLSHEREAYAMRIVDFWSLSMPSYQTEPSFFYLLVSNSLLSKVFVTFTSDIGLLFLFWLVSGYRFILLARIFLEFQ